MIDPENVPEVDDSEVVARYATQSSHFRANGTARSDLFFPHPHQELSVTRHLLATEEEIWRVGQSVADAQKKKLYGRADVEAIAFVEQDLSFRKDPLPTNPNHANVVGWAGDKPSQKTKAQLIAAKSNFIKII